MRNFTAKWKKDEYRLEEEIVQVKKKRIINTVIIKGEMKKEACRN